MLTVAGIVSLVGVLVAAPVLHKAWKRIQAGGDVPPQAELERMADDVRPASAEPIDH